MQQSRSELELRLLQHYQVDREEFYAREESTREAYLRERAEAFLEKRAAQNPKQALIELRERWQVLRAVRDTE